MSNTWRRAVSALQLGLLALTLFVSAACAATSTPVAAQYPRHGSHCPGRSKSQRDGYADAYPRTQGRV